jgi:hypothetical protein
LDQAEIRRLGCGRTARSSRACRSG